MVLRTFIGLLVLVASALPAAAAQKAAVFPFDLIFQMSEEDFFYGTPKISPDEARRLKLVHDEFTKMVGAKSGYEMLDIAPVAADIEKAAPLKDCNGCEMDFAQKLGADIVFLGVIEKASATLLNMTVIMVDVAKGKKIKEFSAVVHGNTDDAWLGVTRWIVRNRVLPPKEDAK